MTSIKRLQRRAHEAAVDKGWWDDCLMQGKYPHPLEISNKINLIHAEVSESTEELRKGHCCYEMYTDEGRPAGEDGEPEKPEGLVVELADAVIRIFDLCGKMGWDLEGAILAKMDYNKTRPHRHGKVL